MRYRVLVVDDERSITRSLQRVLVDREYEVEVASTGQDGLAAMERFRPHIVLLDLKLPDASGFDLLPQLHKIESAAQVIVLTAFGDTKSAVRAVKAGATDFLRKPYDLDELILAVETAGRAFSRDAQLSGYRRRSRGLYNPDAVLWRCSQMRTVWETVRKVARSDAPSVLITGESGTGKEMVARAIHFESVRRQAPFMDVNCSTFQETLLENELFGHERGAFTGASYMKRGLVELSDGGTLFLDEVGDMPASTQAKLLRFLEDRSFKRVGGNVDIRVDIRVVAATNVDLSRRIGEGRFRKDLFYRLQGITIHLPPLRERDEDVLLLAEHFLREYSGKYRKIFAAVDPDARRALLDYPWPGNVRELRNLIERVVLIEDDSSLRLPHLPPELLEERPQLWPRDDGEDEAAREATVGAVRDNGGATRSRVAGGPASHGVAEAAGVGAAVGAAGSAEDSAANGAGDGAAVDAEAGAGPANDDGARDGHDGAAAGPGPRRGRPGAHRMLSLREVEDEHIRHVLESCDGNKSRAARILGISRQGLHDRLKRLDVSA